MVAPPDNDVLWARGLTYAHDGSPALLGVSMGVREGEIVAVTGPRGSGKTTLLRCLSGQLRTQRGEVWFNSVPVHRMGALARERLRLDRFAWIDPEPVLVPELNAWENTALPLLLRGIGRRAAKAAALEWLERLDIRDGARKRPHALLQAERQRVVVARALVCAPTVLFADEPTAPLHRAEHTHVLRTLTAAARSHGITVVLATHDPDTAALADRTVSLLDGRHVRTVNLPSAAHGQGRSPAARDHRPTVDDTLAGALSLRADRANLTAPEPGGPPVGARPGRTSTETDGNHPGPEPAATATKRHTPTTAAGTARSTSATTAGTANTARPTPTTTVTATDRPAPRTTVRTAAEGQQGTRTTRATPPSHPPTRSPRPTDSTTSDDPTAEEDRPSAPVEGRRPAAVAEAGPPAEGESQPPVPGDAQPPAQGEAPQPAEADVRPAEADVRPAGATRSSAADGEGRAACSLSV